MLNKINHLKGTEMNKEEIILGFMKDENYTPMKAKEIAILLGVPKKEYNQFTQTLKKLEEDYKIVKNKKNRYRVIGENFVESPRRTGQKPLRPCLFPVRSFPSAQSASRRRSRPAAALRRKAGPIHFDTSRFLLSGESGLTPPLARRGQCNGAQQALLNLGSAHIGGKSLVDELLQRFRLLLFRDGAYDGLTHDIAAAVDHIGGGIGKDVGSKFSRLTVGVKIHILIGGALLGQHVLRLGNRCLVAVQRVFEIVVFF